MTALLNSLFAALSPLWDMSLTAAYAAAVVVVLRFILKKRAPKQVLCLLWLVVFARLLVPLSLESPVSLVPNALPRQEQVQPETVLPSGQGSGVQTDPAPVQPSAPAQPNGVTADPVVQGNPGPVLTVPDGADPAPEPAPASFPWRALLAGVWLAGAAAMALSGLISCLRLKSCLFDAIRARDGAWEHPAVRSPFILGLFRPRIYLPAGLTGQPRQFILCHERAHLRRLDHLVKPLCWAALALHWFNPAAWLSFILMSRDIEAACDEAVLRQLGPKVKADYSETLLALATDGRMPAPCPLAFDEGDAKNRIQNVLRYRRPALWIVVVSAVMAVMAAVCLLTDPVSAKSPDPGPDASPSASQAPDQDLNALLEPWMAGVLDGERSFLAGSEEYRIDQLRAMAFGDEFPELTLKAGKLAIMDLDKDGVNEMVVWPTDESGSTTEASHTVGYLIFRRQGDAVYVYNPGSRVCNTLKADGTFTWSGSSHYWGFGSAKFTENGFEIENITWCDATGDGEQYFVNGLKVTQEEFVAATGQSEQNRKPEPTWYVYEDGQLKYATIRVPIPLDEYAQAAPVPDFLDSDQQLIYRQAYTMYDHIFGPNTEEVDNWPGGSGYQGGGAVDGYVPATGLYHNWSDFEEAVLSVFTREFWDARNNWGDGSPVYTNIDGQLYYIAAARGNTGNNTYFPETFRLVDQTEDAVSFTVTAHYTEHPGDVPPEGWDAYLRSRWDYSIEFPIRMVRTEQGWRFDEFYCPMTDDNGLFQRVPNPNAAPLPSIEPTPAPERTVISEQQDMQIVSVGGVYRLHWTQNGQDFPVGPENPSADYNPWLEDFDEDGQPEALFPQDGSFPFTIYDFVDGALVGHPIIDMNQVYANISASSVAAYNPSTGGLTITFPWGEGDSRQYISVHTTLPADFFTDCEELADGRPLRMSVTPGSLNGAFVPRGFSYRAKITLTDGTAVSPEAGFAYFGVRYSDSGFEVRTPQESDFNFERVISA